MVKDAERIKPITPLDVPDFPDRVRGVLLGLAVGDALGCPVEGMHPRHLRQRFGEVRDVLDPFEIWRNDPRRGRLKGLYSDDTQQALVVFEACLPTGRFDPRLAAELYLKLADQDAGGVPGAHRGTGPNFRRALKRMRLHKDPLASGTGSGGVGAAMKVPPVGIFHCRDPSGVGLAEDATMVAIMVQADLRAVSGACAVAWAVATMLGEEDPEGVDEKAVLGKCADFVNQAEAVALERFGKRVRFQEGTGQVGRVIRAVTGSWGRPPAEMFEVIVREANKCAPAAPVKFPSQGFAPAAVPACLYLALSAGSFEEALVAAVNLGKDADTVGAIVGAVAGARFGGRSIPARWLDELVNREGVEARATAALLGVKPANWEDLWAMEARLTRREVETRKGLLKPGPSR
ncbi:MAG: ADP-ribosylglycohydrolase family protein [Promethearchaeota archaeon]